VGQQSAANATATITMAQCNQTIRDKLAELKCQLWKL